MPPPSPPLTPAALLLLLLALLVHLSPALAAPQHYHAHYRPAAPSGPTARPPEPLVPAEPAAADDEELMMEMLENTRETPPTLESDAARRVLAKWLFDALNNKSLNEVAALLDHSTQQPKEVANLEASEGSPARIAGSLLEPASQTANPLAINNHTNSSTRPYYGDSLYSFQSSYYPIHCVICLAICTLGIFANLTNIVVLTRSNMITAVNTILSAMAFSDLIVNISNIPFLWHELGATSYSASTHFTFQWAVYTLIHAHTTVTAHTISIWLTCVLATWRYFVVCRTHSSNQKNWSVGLAKRLIVAVFLSVPVFCIPNYLSFAIVEETNNKNSTFFRVGYSHLAEGSEFIRTFHFWIFGWLTKLIPCVLLSFFTTVLIRKLLSARERRLRLTATGNIQAKDTDTSKLSISNGGAGAGGTGLQTTTNTGSDLIDQTRSESEKLAMTITNVKPEGNPARVILNGARQAGFVFSPHDHRNVSTMMTTILGDVTQSTSAFELVRPNHQSDNWLERKQTNRAPSGTSIAHVQESHEVATSCENNTSGCAPDQLVSKHSHNKLGSQMIVESVANNALVSTSTVPASRGSDSCDIARLIQMGLSPTSKPTESPRSASTCLELYGGKSDEAKLAHDNQPLVLLAMTASQDLSGITANSAPKSRRSLATSAVVGSSVGNISDGERVKFYEKRSSETTFASRSRSTLAPFQIKLQASQRQISQNETTTRLLIAVMIVFLICEIPAGILAALCAVIGKDFIENVYHPMGILTDLLALINSSVNFILYCFMSTQFRITFYQVVLRCPAQSVPQQSNHQAYVMTTENPKQSQIRNKDINNND